MKMNRRKILIALTVALPLALIIPLRALRSWQPHFIDLPTTQKVGQQNRNRDLFWCPNGLFLARADSVVWKGPFETRNWDGESLTVRAVNAWRVSLDANGKTAAIVTKREQFPSTRLHDFWDVEAGAAHGIIGAMPGEQQQWNFHSQSYNWVISSDSQRAAWDDGLTGLPNQIVHLGSSATVIADADFDTGVRKVNALAFSPNNRELAIVGENRVLFIDAQTGKLRRKFATAQPSYRDAAQWSPNVRWSPDGKTLAIYGGHAFVQTYSPAGKPRNHEFLYVHDAQSGKLICSWSQIVDLEQTQGIINVSYSPDSGQLALGTYDGQALLMNLKLGALERSFPSDSKLIPVPQSVAFAPDGNTLAVAAQNKITLWRIK